MILPLAIVPWTLYLAIPVSESVADFGAVCAAAGGFGLCDGFEL